MNEWNDNFSCYEASEEKKAEIQKCKDDPDTFWLRDPYDMESSECVTAQKGCEELSEFGPGFEWDANMGQCKVKCSLPGEPVQCGPGKFSAFYTYPNGTLPPGYRK